MKANRLVDKLLHNWYIKIICFVLAVFLYIFHQTSMVDKRSFVLPLDIEENGSYMIVGQVPKKVTIVVRASTEDITAVHPSQIQASINLDNIITPGDYTLPIFIKVDEELMNFDPFEIKVKPETIKIKAERKDIKYIQVEPSIVGEPDYGYEITDVLVSPSYVEVEGPESVLKNIQTIKTDIVDITNATKNLSLKASYREINKVINVLDEGPYDVSVIIEPIRMERDFTGIEIMPLNLNETLEIKDKAGEITFKLSGALNQLEKFNRLTNIATVDCSAIKQPGTYELPVKLNIPGYFRIEETSLNIITVEVIEAPPVTEETSEEQALGE